MALLPLAGPRRRWQAGDMDAYSSWIVRLARQVRHAALEFYRATKLANELRFSYGLVETRPAP